MSHNPNLGQFRNVTACRSPEKLTVFVYVCMENDKYRIQDELSDKNKRKKFMPSFGANYLIIFSYLHKLKRH